jgi:hypothetical protein
MESKVAKEAERVLAETTRQMSPEERLEALLEHSQLVMDLYEAGEQLRARERQAKP